MRVFNGSAILIVVALISFAAWAGARTEEYSSVRFDDEGQLFITLGSGREIRPKKITNQIGFGSPQISLDRTRVGWLVLYPFPAPPGSNYHADPIAGALVVYRAGRVLHIFSTDQIFWGWKFVGDGSQVAYSTGPAHGDAALCFLVDVQSGRELARWYTKSGNDPPSWARDLGL